MNVIDNSHMEQIINYMEANKEANLKISKAARGYLLQLTINDRVLPDTMRVTGATFSEAVKKMSELVYASTKE